MVTASPNAGRLMYWHAHYPVLLIAAIKYPREMVYYLIGKKTMPDFVTPLYTVERQDSDEIRQKKS
jgi:hypothetical protein